MIYKEFDIELMAQMHETLQVIFRELEGATTIDDINLLSGSEYLKGYKFDDGKYPQLQFKLTREDIKLLIDQGIIDKDYKINGATLTDPLAKLLYSVLWKQGDLLKIKHIIMGIQSEKEETSDTALVFYQFGKHLASADEPIIDQHVLRAYAYYKYLKSGRNGEFKSKAVLSKKDQKLIEEYKKWLGEGLHDSLKKEPKYTYHVDKLMFSIGKYIKANYDMAKLDIVYTPAKL